MRRIIFSLIITIIFASGGTLLFIIKGHPFWSWAQMVITFVIVYSIFYFVDKKFDKKSTS